MSMNRRLHAALTRAEGVTKGKAARAAERAYREWLRERFGWSDAAIDDRQPGQDTGLRGEALDDEIRRLAANLTPEDFRQARGEWA